MKYIVASTTTTDGWINIPSMCIIPVNDANRKALSDLQALVAHAVDVLGMSDVTVIAPFEAAWLDHHPDIEHSPDGSDYYAITLDAEIKTEWCHLRVTSSDAVVVRDGDLECESCYLPMTKKEEQNDSL